MWFLRPVSEAPLNLPALCGPLPDPPGGAGIADRRPRRKEREERNDVSSWALQLGLSKKVADAACDYLAGWLSQRVQRGAARREAVVAASFYACKGRWYAD
jgi:hypothetical protein